MTEAMDAHLARFARDRPEDLAAVDGALRWHYGDLDARVTALAHWLIGQGVRPGDRVAVAAPPGLIYYTALMAIARAGAIYVGVNPRYTAVEATHVITLTAPRLILLDGRAGDDLERVLAEAAPDLAGCDALMLAQFSTSVAMPAVSAVLDCPVLTSPASAVSKLKALLQP